MGRKIYVTNVYNLTSEALETLFAEYGQVEDARVIIDKDGNSKGLGFVTMGDDEDALTAIEGLNGREVAGEPIGAGLKPPKEGWQSPRLRREAAARQAAG